MRIFLVGCSICLLVAADNPLQAPRAARFEVPYRLAPTQHIIVRAKVNGQGPFNFVLDTGAPLLILAKKLEIALGMKPDTNGWTTLNRFEVEGGAVIENLTARFDELYQLESMNGLGLAGTEIHGLMGYSVLARFRIEIDFSKVHLVWTRVDYQPEEPARAGSAFIPQGLNMIGGLMKGVGKLFGMDRPPVSVYRPFLGLKVKEADRNVIVESIFPDGPVELAAKPLQPGDVIIRVNDFAIRTLAEFQMAQAKLRVGEAAIITAVRNGSELKIEVKPSGGF